MRKLWPAQRIIFTWVQTTELGERVTTCFLVLLMTLMFMLMLMMLVLMMLVVLMALMNMNMLMFIKDKYAGPVIRL